jgi:DNA adenine methylase
MMNTTAITPWYGSKRTIAPQIVAALGKHRCYWELFCGSMAVLFGKPVATMETVNDLHGDLINLARVIQNDSTWPVLLSRLQRTLVSPVLWKEAVERLKTPYVPGIDRAADYFVFCWLGRNGSAGSNGGQNFCVRYTSNGGSPGTRFKSTVDSIPVWAERLRAVIILNEDAFSLIERIEDKDGTAIYCDPPYLVKSAKYTHDFKAEDHHRLAEMLRRFKQTRVVVSYYDHPLLPELYPGWRMKKIEVTKSMVNQGQRDKSGATKAVEMLLVNQGDVGLF